MPESFKDNPAYCESARGVCVRRVNAIQKADLLKEKIERCAGKTSLFDMLGYLVAGRPYMPQEDMDEMRNHLAGLEVLIALNCNLPGTCIVEQAQQANAYQRELTGQMA